MKKMLLLSFFIIANSSVSTIEAFQIWNYVEENLTVIIPNVTVAHIPAARTEVQEQILDEGVAEATLEETRLDQPRTLKVCKVAKIPILEQSTFDLVRKFTFIIGNQSYTISLNEINPLNPLIAGLYQNLAIPLTPNDRVLAITVDENLIETTDGTSSIDRRVRMWFYVTASPTLREFPLIPLDPDRSN